MTTKNILILTYWDFNDALIQTYTLPYLKIISNNINDESKIFLLTLNKKNISTSFNHPKIKVLNFCYIPFGIKAIFYYGFMLLYLIWFIYKNKITHIHAWCTPAGVFGYILSVLTNKPLIIDSYEPHAEAMIEVGEWKKKSLAFKFLFFMENKMTHRAKYLIATTESMIKEYAVKKYNFDVNKNNWFVKPACVDFQIFQPNEEKRKLIRAQLGIENKITGIYAGKFGGIYLEDDFFQWLKTAQEYWNDKFSFILLSSHNKDYISLKCKKFHIDEKIIIHRFVPHHQVADYLNASDFGITPVKPVYTKKFCSPIKDGEYWAVGLPVIITKDISDDSKIIEKHNIGYVLKDLNEKEYLQSVLYLDNLLKENIKSKIIEIAHKYRDFEKIKYIYKKIYGE